MSVASNVVCAELSLYNSSYIVVLQLHGSQVYTCNRFVAPSDVVLIPEVVFIIHLSITFLILAWFTAMMQQFAIASSLISSENIAALNHIMNLSRGIVLLKEIWIHAN